MSTYDDLRLVPLTAVRSGSSLGWVKAELPRPGSSLAAVTYTIDGKEEPRRLRLDLGKGVFLDRPSDPELAAKMNEAVPALVDAIARREP